jgi:hypothetical protein
MTDHMTNKNKTPKHHENIFLGEQYVPLSMQNVIFARDAGERR